MSVAVIVNTLLVPVLIYCFYQLVRNHAVYRIRKKWILSDDERWYKYSYEFMFDRSKHNWHGIKFPRESDYP